MPILNAARNYYESPITYDDALHLWLTGEHDALDPCTHRCDRSSGLLERTWIGVVDDAAFGTVVCDPSWASSMNFAVSPVPSAGHGPQGPNAFAIYSFGPYGDLICEVHHHGDELGIGEHYRLTSTPESTSQHYHLILPGVSGTWRRMYGDNEPTRNHTVRIARQQGARDGADDLAVLYLFDKDFACPTRGTVLQSDPGRAHEGTIILPDGSFLTNVYEAVYAPAMRATCAKYLTDVYRPIDALANNAPRARRRPAKWAGAAAGLVATAAAVLHRSSR